jgi:HK97 family phage prohead protease
MKGIVSGVRSDEDRAVQGVFATLGANEVLTSMSLEREQLAWIEFDQVAFYRQVERLTEDDLLAISVDINHDVPGLGRCLALGVHPHQLRGIIELHDTPGCDEVWRGVHDGRIAGFSIDADIIRSVGRGERGGYPRLLVTEARLRGISLCPSPADTRAIIESIGGEVPQWQEMGSRQEAMQEMRARPPRVRRYQLASQWHEGHFGGFAR